MIIAFFSSYCGIYWLFKILFITSLFHFGTKLFPIVWISFVEMTEYWFKKKMEGKCFDFCGDWASNSPLFYYLTKYLPIYQQAQRRLKAIPNYNTSIITTRQNVSYYSSHWNFLCVKYRCNYSLFSRIDYEINRKMLINMKYYL